MKYEEYARLPKATRIAVLRVKVRSAGWWAVFNWLWLATGAVALMATGSDAGVLVLWFVLIGPFAAYGTYCWWKAHADLKAVMILEESDV